MYLSKLRDLREDNDLTQQQLADYLYVAQATYSEYERGKISIPSEILWELADFYKTSTDYLIGRTDNPEPPRK